MPEITVRLKPKPKGLGYSSFGQNILPKTHHPIAP